ncbi:MAG: T9SS C-terminal target domain-containing protein, partial [Candidatus Latescibacterota bacterium]
VVNAGTANKLLRNTGVGGFVDATPPLLADASGLGLAAAWGDYDGDGDLDLYLCNGSTGNKLFRNDGAGAFADATSGPLSDGGVTYGADWGDFDNDGDLDLAIANEGSPSKLFRNDGGGVFALAGVGTIGTAVSAYGIAWADTDNDGDLDLFVAQSSANRLFKNEGGSFVEDADAALRDAPSGAGAAFADYDADGDLDLYLVNLGGANSLWRNDSGAGNRWLHVALVGGASNRSAIGARVHVFAAGTHRIREISGGSGFASQHSLAAEFGLGGAALVDSVRVDWPSGATTDTAAIAADQVLVLVEPGGPTGTSGPPLPASHALHGNFPNPFNPVTTVRFALPEKSEVRLAVYDVSGRFVRLLQEGVSPAGVFEATWDGRDFAGRDAGSGAYFVRLEAGRFQATRKMLLVR